MTSDSRSLQVNVPNRTCLTLLEAAPSNYTIYWNTGQTSIGPATDILACTLGLGTVASIHSTVALEITSL